MLLIDRSFRWYERFALAMLSMGPIPRHIAFIMDGNRRYAQQNGMKSALIGHRCGYEKLCTVLRYCAALNIQYVTVYAFSMDNFQRPKQEVEDLMALAEEKFTEMTTQKHIVQRYGVKIRFMGMKKMAPQTVQRAMEAAEEMTKQNQRIVLNVCFAYSGQEEIARAVTTAARDVKAGTISAKQLSTDAIKKRMYSPHSPDVDLLVRTSGEYRLSDFMLWQCRESRLHFIRTLWPQITLFHLVYILLDYQWSILISGGSSDAMN